MVHCNFHFKKHKKLLKLSQIGEDKDGVHDNDYNDDRFDDGNNYSDDIF